MIGRTVFVTVLALGAGTTMMPAAPAVIGTRDVAETHTGVFEATPPPPALTAAAISWQRTPAALPDSAETLYRAARAALNASDYGHAATLFREVHDRFAASSHAADAHYWEAFALYRTGEPELLRQALATLEAQRARYPEAAARGDAPVLHMRLLGELARSGDANAALAVTVAASAGAKGNPADTLVHAALARLAGELDSASRQSREATAYVRALEPPFAGASPAGRIEVYTGVSPAAVDTPITVRRGTVTFRGDLGTPQAFVFTTPGALPADCPREEYDLRRTALQALSRLDPAAAAPMLQQVLELRDPCSRPLRLQAITLLATRPAPATVDILLAVAAGDPDAEVRAAAVQRLATSRDERALDAVQEILFTSGDMELRQRALRALAGARGERAHTLLREAVTRSDLPDELRSQAITQLARTPTPENLALLRDIYPTLTDDRLKEQILTAAGGTRLAVSAQGDWNFVAPLYEQATRVNVGRQQALEAAMQQLEAAREQQATAVELWGRANLGHGRVVLATGQGAGALDEEHVAWLMGIARNRNESMPLRTRAVHAAGPHVPVAALLELYDAEPDESMRLQIISVLGRRQEDAALEKLIQIALSDQPVGLRRAAVGWLGQSDDPRAARALVELISR